MCLCQMADIIASCIGYAIRQVETSDIDIMGFKAAGYDDDEAKLENLKQLVEVYNEIDNLTYTSPYYGLSRTHINELMKRWCKTC